MYSREKAKYYSKLFKDRPMTAMDTATYWVEYVIRNGGAPLRSPALDLPWWQIHSLDIFAFIILTLALLTSMAYCLSKFILKKCFSNQVEKAKVQ